ncbi:MAG: nitrous oxide reductase accessory protein NosL [Desulfuromonadales bacterium]|nr:nitrous oxide reductase accessory protein NosL [Desulfuromonadales bacterium]
MRYLVFALLFCSLSAAALAAVPPPEEKDRCAVCGMFVAPFPQWTAALELKDGRRFYFDGPKDLFIGLFDLPTYFPGVSAEQVTGVYVTEYYGASLKPAAEVIFVTGSDVLGPMGQELVPVIGREPAETFRRDHAGKALMRFDGRQLIEIKEQP